MYEVRQEKRILNENYKIQTFKIEVTMLKKLKQKYQKEIIVATQLAQPQKMREALLAVQEYFNEKPLKYVKDSGVEIDMCAKMKALNFDIS